MSHAIDELAKVLYERDWFQEGCRLSVDEAWLADREAVRERFRVEARKLVEPDLSIPTQHNLELRFLREPTDENWQKLQAHKIEGHQRWLRYQEELGFFRPQLGRRIAELLYWHDIKDWRQLAAATDEQLLAINGFGIVSLHKVRDALWDREERWPWLAH
jgi:hypothetical protein